MTDDDTADAMSIRRIRHIIEQLRYERFRFRPVRREYIDKQIAQVEALLGRRPPGRPRKNPGAEAAPAPAKKRKMSAAARKRMSEAQRRRRAEEKKAGETSA